MSFLPKTQLPWLWALAWTLQWPSWFETFQGCVCFCQSPGSLVTLVTSVLSSLPFSTLVLSSLPSFGVLLDHVVTASELVALSWTTLLWDHTTGPGPLSNGHIQGHIFGIFGFGTSWSDLGPCSQLDQSLQTSPSLLGGSSPSLLK